MATYFSLSSILQIGFSHLLSFFTKKTNRKITILQILVYKIQPEIMKSKIFMRFNFIKNVQLKDNSMLKGFQTKEISKYERN